MEPVAGPSGESGHGRGRRRNILQSEASTSSEAPPFSSPQKKRPKTILTSGERLMIINIVKYVKKTKPEAECLSNYDIVKKTSEICGVSERSIYRVLREYSDTHTISEPVHKRNRLNIVQKIDDFDKSAIRKIVHSFFLKGELPTIKKILQNVNDDETLPSLSITSLRRILKHLKFKFMKRQNKSILMDRRDIVLWRIKYLKEIKQFREQNRRIFYTDETWVNAGNFCSNNSFFSLLQSPRT